MKQKEKDAVLIELRRKEYTYREIQEITGRDQHNIRKRCIQLGIAYDPSEDHSGRKPEEQFSEELKALNLGIEYVSGYENNKSTVTVRCIECGHIFTWNVSNLRHKYTYAKCDMCAVARMEEKEKERKQKAQRELLKKERNRMSKYLIKREETATCKWCGATFARVKGFGNVQRIYCSQQCLDEMKEDNRKKHRKDERLKKCGRRQWNISVKRLYARDKGICWLCGKPTDMNDFRKDEHGNVICGESYPSIDHVVPVSRGGDHTWDNIRLAHRGCNSKRGAPSIA